MKFQKTEVSSIRPVKIAVEIGLLFDTFNHNHYRDTAFSRMVQQVLNQDVQEVKFYWILNRCSQEAVPGIEEALHSHGFRGESAYLAEEGDIIHYLDRCDLFFSEDAKLLYAAGERGILGGYLPVEALAQPKVVLAFDHRIFIDEHNQPAIKGWLKIIGHLQRGRSYVITALITTSSSSVEKRVIELFQKSHCSINELFYLGAGTPKDVFRLFGPCLYFEGRRRREVRVRTHGRPLLFV